MAKTSGNELHVIGHNDILIIVCHGFNSSSRNETLVAIVAGLNANGFDTLTFTFSENLGGFDVEAQVTEIGTMVQQHSQYKHIVLLAASFAALPAAISAAKVSEVHGLITLNGFFGKAALGETYRKPYIKFRFAALVIPKYRRILRYFKRELQPELIEIPCLIVHSKADQDVFPIQSEQFYSALQSKKRFIHLESANHGIRDTADRKLVIGEISNWLKRTF